MLIMSDTPDSKNEVSSASIVAEEKSDAVPTFPDGGLKAWLAVAGAFSTMFCTFGYLSTFGVLESYYFSNLLRGSSHSEIAWIGSLQAFFMCTTGLVSGPLVDRYGTKGILGGFGIGMLYTPAISILGHYFQEKRDLAIGISSAGSPLGGIIFPIALNRFLQHTDIGFPWSVRIIGFIMLVLLSIACATLVPRISPRKGPHFLPAAFKKPVYSLQVVGYSVIFWGIYTPFFFLPAYATSHGVDVDWAFYIMPIYNSGSFMGRIVGSRLTLYLGRFNTLIGAIFISGVLEFCWLATSNLGGLVTFAVLFGISSGAIIGLFPTTVAMTAPQANQIGTYLGMMMGALGVFCLTGSPMMGAIVSSSGFTPAIAFSAALTMLGGIMILVARIFHSKEIVA
ncbi:Major Facilitator Superfamily protein [Coccidioides posadasii C735 delta SOWgp]|uniref:Major Facilitator Superfamily protein n=1 Tax=Coccidioides posadasii (strain C735) TaxID=222929 RepID=C5PH74_COCP7|nr:Major Facilitator Superfamily protein [Coccidioides posadasii C735 delta SOWgp]EER23877.1 Major Facilitator Superfamily protein [Coccidioides posadasii C735 delta SOWgp]|eukprot:XP_003066022.1 Major Facilitator Superfamily protein [Coccidioides posadasii C735 delta SOWgp]